MTPRISSSMRRLAAGGLLMLAIGGCAVDRPVFTPPAARPTDAASEAWPRNAYLALAYHDVEDRDPDQRYLSVETRQLAEQFAWLDASGYIPVSVEQILRAGNGGPDLPARAVLLSFDDGYRSFYTRVFPLLRARGWPAVLAPVGAWLDAPQDHPVLFGDTPTARDRFLDWRQVREMSDSGLIEIAAHTYALHQGLAANPQGNLQPAAAARAYDPATGRYEDETVQRERLRRDIHRISARIRQVTGKAPRVWVWPYGEPGGVTLALVRQAGYRMALKLDSGLASARRPFDTPRLLIANNPSIEGFARACQDMERPVRMRAAQVDLDAVYDPDPAQTERNLGRLVERIARLQISTVFLQAFADPRGDGRITSVYFPNRELPMRADLFNRAAWQLRTRAEVRVYAWMPVLGLALPTPPASVQAWTPPGREPDHAPGLRRLSPFDPETSRRVGGLYEDLARAAIFDGILFHDDAVLSDFEDAGPAALAAYRAAGLPADIGALRASPDTMRQWTRLKSRRLIALTDELAARVRAIRGPQIRTARNLFAGPILDPDQEAWFAQNLDDFLAAYDWVVPMAMPRMEHVPAGREAAWLDRLVDAVAARPTGLDKTVFEVQTLDWAAPGGARPVPADTVAGWLRRLQARGARHLAYYPDDFIKDRPAPDALRQAISNAWYPYP